MCETAQFKTCSKCGEEKPLLAFRPKETGKFGVRADCRDCQNAQMRESRRATGHAISDEAREAKRARDRARQKRLQGTHAKKEINARNQKKQYAKVREKRISEGVFGYSVCAVTPIECVVCGKKKVVKGKDGRFCSKRCSYRYRGLQQRVTQRACGCGVLFAGKGKASLCDACRRANVIRNKREVPQKFRAKARRYGCYYEPINRAHIYARDKFRCAYCRVRVVVSDTWRPDMATLDHIVPLSKGGPHAPHNVTTCCSMCNSIKSDKIVNDIQLSIYHNG